MEEARALGLCFPRVIPPLAAGIVDQLGEQHRTGRRQRPPRPPQMEGGRMPVADGFFTGGRGVDVV
jgi:hypothetical protein